MAQGCSTTCSLTCRPCNDALSASPCALAGLDPRACRAHPADALILVPPVCPVAPPTPCQVVGLGWPNYWKSGWNRFDLALVLSSLADMVVTLAGNAELNALKIQKVSVGRGLLLATTCLSAGLHGCLPALVMPCGLPRLSRPQITQNIGKAQQLSWEQG
jgi:hypothetical protein